MNSKKIAILAAGSALLFSSLGVTPVLADDGINASSSENESFMTADVQTYANIREGASTDTEIIGSLYPGEVVTADGTEGNWTKVTKDGLEGYIYTGLLAISDEDGNIIGDTADDSASETAAVSGKRMDLTDDDLKLLAALIECEAGGESYEGQVAVGAVVLNRVESSSFPNTIHDVIYQSGQFTPASSGALASVLSRGASDSCVKAAQAAANGENPIGSCLYFHAGGGSGTTIGNQTFY